MAARVGIIAIQHESNTFISQPTTRKQFEDDGHIVEGSEVRDLYITSKHEVAGFFHGLECEQLEAVPVFSAWAMPSGTIEAGIANELVNRALTLAKQAGPIDGWLLAPHGAGVAENAPDFDGHWMSLLREQVGRSVPIIATLDLHANVSQKMVDACDALIAYRTNPHLDQLDRGMEAALLMGSTLREEIRPVMRARFPSLAVNIERQATADPHWNPLLDLAFQQREFRGALSNSLVYGFPYADVAEMGSSVIAVTDDDAALADRLAQELSDLWWQNRADFAGELIEVDAAVHMAASEEGPVCLLDMGDNVGGGSAADGTILAHEFHRRGWGPTLVVIADPDSVQRCQAAGIGARLTLKMGGKTDDMHGPPLEAEVQVISFHSGQFEEPEVRHGGRRFYDQGPTVVVKTDTGLTVILTTLRMAPMSLQQVISTGEDPWRYRFLIAKGVNAPVAAYSPVCKRLIRVNTPGTTTADMGKLKYKHRRTPLYPLEK